MKDAGQLIDPCVSVPRANGANPAATAATDPADEPHGCFELLAKFRVKDSDADLQIVW